ALRSDLGEPRLAHPVQPGQHGEGRIALALLPGAQLERAHVLYVEAAMNRDARRLDKARVGVLAALLERQPAAGLGRTAGDRHDAHLNRSLTPRVYSNSLQGGRRAHEPPMSRRRRVLGTPCRWATWP